MTRANRSSARLAAVALTCAGCSTLLGLDDVGYVDGGVGDTGAPDAPTVTDGGPDALPGDAHVDAPTTDASDAPTTPDAPRTTLPKEILADKPVAYFPLDEGAGANAVVDLIAGAQGTVLGPLQLGVAGVAGTSVTFPNTKTNYIDVPTGYDFVGGVPFSVELWARPRFPSGSSQMVFDALTKSSVTNGYTVFFNRAGSAVNAQFAIGDTNSAVLASGAVPVVVDDAGLDAGLTTSDWIHIVGTFDGKIARLYLNGAVVNLVMLPVDGGGRPVDAGDPLKVGYSFLGEIDEVALYDKTLPANRVQAHFLAR